MRTALGILLALLTAASGRPDQQDERQIWDSAFRKQRPVAAPSAARKGNRDLAYESKSAKPIHTANRVPVLGLTTWFAREPRSDEQNVPRLLVQRPESRRTEVVLERLRPGQALQAQDSVRLSIEIPREGYLYVVNRERYDDGRTGPPNLIFPATNLNQGSNKVQPGQVINIPAESDVPNLLTLSRSSRNHNGEELLIIVSPTPLSDVIPADREVRLDPELVARWERDWAVATERLDLVGGMRSWTASEKLAGAQGRLLTQGDPMPQSIYHAPADRSQPQLVKVLLEVR